MSRRCNETEPHSRIANIEPAQWLEALRSPRCARRFPTHPKPPSRQRVATIPNRRRSLRADHGTPTNLDLSQDERAGPYTPFADGRANASCDRGTLPAAGLSRTQPLDRPLIPGHLSRRSPQHLGRTALSCEPSLGSALASAIEREPNPPSGPLPAAFEFSAKSGLSHSPQHELDEAANRLGIASVPCWISEPCSLEAMPPSIRQISPRAEPILQKWRRPAGHHFFQVN